MDLQNEETLILPQELPVRTYNKLISILNRNQSWELVAECFDFFSEEFIQNVRLKPNPAEYTLNELGIRLCNVRMLCLVLEECRLYNALLLFRNHEPIVITEQPYYGDNNTGIIFKGHSLRLRCKAVGFPPPEYQWYVGNHLIPSASDPNLVIENFDFKDEGEYVCYVSQEGFESISSNVISVNLAPELPFITSQPTPCIVSRHGARVILKIKAFGHPKVHYQWYKDSLMLPDCVHPEFEIETVTEKDEGCYRCYLNNTAGELWSDQCQLTVYASPEDLDEGNECRPVASAKVALLIGNQDYQNPEMPDLKTPQNDVKTLAEIFRQRGFSVIALKNLTLTEMRRTIWEFCKILPKGAYVIFYYAGHGFEMRQKYMLPIDAPGPDSYLTGHALSESELLRDVLATSPQVFIELLDMCLKPPVEENKAIFEEVTTLHQYRPNDNLIQSYSTTSYLGAYEKGTDINGLYVKALQKYLLQDILIITILDKAARDILKEYPEQIPYRGTNVTKGFRLTDACEGNESVENQIEFLMHVPDEQTITLKNGQKHDVQYSPYYGVFCNILQITFVNLSQYKIAYQKSFENDIKRYEEDILVTIENVQRLKGDEILNLDIIDSNGQKIDQLSWPLGKPLIRMSDSWCNADL